MPASRNVSRETLSERQICFTLNEYFNLNPRTRKRVIHIANEGKRSKIEGHNLKRMGMLPGVSDYFIAIANHGYHGAWIEIKTKKNKPTELQLAFLHDMASEGYFTAVTHGLDESLDTMKWYCKI